MSFRRGSEALWRRTLSSAESRKFILHGSFTHTIHTFHAEYIKFIIFLYTVFFIFYYYFLYYTF